MTRPGSAATLVRRGGSGPPPLPAAAVEYWIDDKGVAASAALVDSWTGQMRSTVVQNTGAARPSYGTDGTGFKGRNVLLFAGGTTLRTASNLATPLVVSGAKPWIYTVCRARAAMTANACIVSFMNGLPAASWPGGSLCIYRADGVNWAWDNFGWTEYAWGPIADTAQHRFETGLSSTGAVIVRMDGAAGNRAAGGSGHATGTDCRAVTFGSDHGQTWPANVAIAFSLLCSAEMTTPERAAMEAWAIGRYG